ncbi:SWIM zinc finger family protein [Aliamphritea spongicola]|uniref:SWIM zinc finger family protein n=1 Tax=Aliamphritea spongicola TaxID=707589 RepID=UPI00196B203A|nr:hypothetical protein [Aliamphritea spongicola]MBN3561972.1 hypothetical protein [Aliamphritea spongicola]
MSAPDFSPELLSHLAGAAQFEAGQALQHTVQDWLEHPDLITGLVSDPYTHTCHSVQLRWPRQQLEGSCDCPVSEGFEFCQHCVALALSVQQSRNTSAGTTTAEQGTVLSYLAGLPKHQLIRQLQQLTANDPKLERQLIRQAQIARGSVDIAGLRKQITQALPYRKLSQRQKIRSYFEHACNELTDLNSCLDALPAEAAFKLCEYTLERLNQVLMRFDPQGYQHPCAELSCRQYTRQLLRQNWPAEQLATFVLEQLNQPREIYPDPLSILTPDNGLESLITKARQRWQNQPANRQLSELLNSYATEYGDHDLLAELLSHSSAPADTDTLLQFIRTQLEQLKTSATNHTADAQEAICQQLQSMFDSLSRQSPDARQLRQQQQLEAEFAALQGQEKESAELYWQIFTQQKNPDSYLNYQQANTAQGISPQQSQQTAEKYLLECAKHSSRAGHQALARSHEHLFEFYLASDQLHKARIIADQLTLSPAHLEALALQLLSTAPQHSQQYYRRILTTLLQEASEQAYTYIAELLQQIPEYAAEHPQCQAAASQLLRELLGELRQQHQHKRQFMRILATHFPT